MPVSTIEALFEHELKDIYDAEKRLTKALPKVAKAVTSEELRTAVQEHLEVTKNQVTRLEEVFRLMEIPAKGKTCAGMKGLIEEAEEVIESTEDVAADVAIAGSARKVEHYEITAYNSLRDMAEAMGEPEVQNLLEETLREEEEADQRLAEICEELLQSAMEDVEEEEIEDGEEEDDEMVAEEEEEKQPTGGGRRR